MRPLCLLVAVLKNCTCFLIFPVVTFIVFFVSFPTQLVNLNALVWFRKLINSSSFFFSLFSFHQIRIAVHQNKIRSRIKKRKINEEKKKETEIEERRKKLCETDRQTDKVDNHEGLPVLLFALVPLWPRPSRLPLLFSH